MPQSTLKLKSSVTKRDPVNPDLKARLADLQHQQEKPALKAQKEQDTPKRNPHALQQQFLISCIKEKAPVDIRLAGGINLDRCTLLETDQYCVLTSDDELLFKSAIAGIKRQGERND